MKKLLLATMVVTAFFFNTETKAQVSVHLNVNLGGRPNWGLPGNYSGNYYYLPEIDSYYDIPRRQFIYSDGVGWVYASELPYQFRDYDLFNGFKVVINEPMPYLHCQVYRERYNRYYNTYQRPVIFENGYPNYPNNRYPINRYDNNRYENNRYNNDQFNRGRENQHFDNKRREDDRDDRDDRGRDRGDERGRGNGHGRGHGRD